MAIVTWGKTRGEPCCSPLDRSLVSLPYSAVGTFSVPAMIFALYEFIVAMNAFGTDGLILPTDMPPFFRLKFRSEPPWNLPALT